MKLGDDTLREYWVNWTETEPGKLSSLPLSKRREYHTWFCAHVPHEAEMPAGHRIDRHWKRVELIWNSIQAEEAKQVAAASAHRSNIAIIITALGVLVSFVSLGLGIWNMLTPRPAPAASTATQSPIAKATPQALPQAPTPNASP